MVVMDVRNVAIAVIFSKRLSSFFFERRVIKAITPVDKAHNRIERSNVVFIFLFIVMLMLFEANVSAECYYFVVLYYFAALVLIFLPFLSQV